MSTEVALPALGESVTEGTVSRWLKQVGDTVAVDEPLVEISTDKVDTEIPSPVAGTLVEIRVNEDETVEVGAVLGVIGEADEAGGSDAGQSDAGQSDAEPEQQAEPEPEQQAEPEPEPEPQPEPEPEEQPAAAQAPEQTQPAASDGDGGTGGDGGGTEVTLPALGESVTEGTVSRWLKQVGDQVEQDEPLVEISTDKVDTELPSPTAGTLTEIRVDQDETVEVGGVLAVIGGSAGSAGGATQEAPADQGSSGPETAQADSADQIEEQPAAGDEGGQAPIPTPERGSAASPQASDQPAQPEPAEPAQPEPAQQSQPEAAARPEASSGQASDKPRRAAESTASTEMTYVTPLVRKLAAEHDVDLDSIAGTGVGGRIRKQDVLAAAEAAQQAKQAQEEAQRAEQDAARQPTKPAAQPAASTPSPEAASLRGTTEKMSRLRATIARRMVESLQVSAQLTATVEVDLTRISRLRARVKNDFLQREGVRLSYLPFITKAVVETLKAFPKVNARIDTEAGTITYSDAEHVGIAVDTPKGLLVPVIRDAGDLNIAGLAKKVVDLADRSRTNKLAPDDLAGGTFTITNYGSVGTLMDTPIINQPQVAILGVGALVKRPVVISDADLGDTIVIRDMMYLSLSYDHRLVDGADAGRFLSALKNRLEEADFEAELGL